MGSDTEIRDDEETRTPDSPGEGDTPNSPEAPAPEEEAPEGPDTDVSEDEDDFRTQQRAAAESQNLSGENAVPEQRPQAFQQVESTQSPLTTRLIEEGAIPDPDAPPMDQAAYDAANDDARKSETAQQGTKPAAHVGTVINVLSGPHRDRRGAVLRIISYASLEDRLARLRGDETSDYAQPKEVEVSFRGDSRDGERAVLDLTEIDYEVVPTGFAGRPAVSGSV